MKTFWQAAFLLSRCLRLIRLHFRKLHHKNGPISLMKRHIKQWLGSLCCSRLSWIKALHGLRDAVIGVEEDGTNAEKWILLDPAAEPSRTLESLQHLIAPPPPICKTKKQKERRRAFRLSSTQQMPQGAPSLCGAVFTAPSDAASAYNSSRKKCHSTGTKKILDASVLFSLRSG